MRVAPLVVVVPRKSFIVLFGYFYYAPEPEGIHGPGPRNSSPVLEAGQERKGA
jgi:hypothetical protein